MIHTCRHRATSPGALCLLATIHKRLNLYHRVMMLRRRNCKSLKDYTNELFLLENHMQVKFWSNQRNLSVFVAWRPVVGCFPQCYPQILCIDAACFWHTVSWRIFRRESFNKCA